MKTYKVPVSYEMYGFVYIDADSLDEALDIAQYSSEVSLPDNADYIDGSWQVDYASAEMHNDKEPPDSVIEALLPYMEYVLEDDETPDGGVAYQGETVREFLANFDDADMPYTLSDLNSILVECGIKPLKEAQ